MLQWGRRVNAAEVLNVCASAAHQCSASMGPPRERGGSAEAPGRMDGERMKLQWGRRVNAAEVMGVLIMANYDKVASMGPPRERGGSQMIQ